MPVVKFTKNSIDITTQNTNDKCLECIKSELSNLILSNIVFSDFDGEFNFQLNSDKIFYTYLSPNPPSVDALSIPRLLIDEKINEINLVRAEGRI